jgi:hypothetical protein
MLTMNLDYFKSKPVNIPKITILLDHGYHVGYLIEQLEKVYPPNHDENPLSIVHQTLETREGSTRKIWICSSNCKVGN